jgi:hypothetical protein
MGQQIVWTDGGQRPTELSDRRADGIDDIYCFHIEQGNFAPANYANFDGHP